MPAPPWRAGSLFGCGPRNPLNRDQRGIMRQRLRSARLRGHITDKHENIGLEMLTLLGPDGELHPRQDTVARRAGCCVRTVSNALRRFRNLGLLDWMRRLVRIGRQVRQTSNAYRFRLDGPNPEAARCERKPCRGGPTPKTPPYNSLHPLPDRADGLASLQAVAKARTAALNAAWQARRR